MWSPNAAFYDEAEKVAALAPLAAGTAVGLAGGLAAHHFVRDAGQTDRILHALGSMSSKDLEERRRKRRRIVVGTGAVLGTGTALAYNPARKAAASRAATFMQEVVRPTVSEAEERARKASKHIAKDIGEDLSGRVRTAQQEFIEGSTRAGENYGKGLVSGLGSNMGVLGRILMRKK